MTQKHITLRWKWEMWDYLSHSTPWVELLCPGFYPFKIFTIIIRMKLTLCLCKLIFYNHPSFCWVNARYGQCLLKYLCDPPNYSHFTQVYITSLCVLCRDDEKISPDGRVTSSLDDLAARLSISNLESMDTGVYTCVARCESGVTRCSTELCVFDSKPATDSYLQPPIFVEGLVPKRTADEGEPVQLTVRLQGETTLHYNAMIITIYSANVVKS